MRNLESFFWRAQIDGVEYGLGMQIERPLSKEFFRKHMPTIFEQIKDTLIAVSMDGPAIRKVKKVKKLKKK